MGTIFANPLEELAEFQDMNKELNEGRGPLQVSGCVDSQKAHLISETGGGKRWKPDCHIRRFQSQGAV